MELNMRLVYAITFYLLLMALIYVSRPSFIFNKDGSRKNFGVGKNKTIYSLGVIVAIGAIMSYYIIVIIDCFF